MARSMERCGMALKKLLVETLLDGDDKLLLRGVFAQGRSKRLKEEGRLVHLL